MDATSVAATVALGIDIVIHWIEKKNPKTKIILFTILLAGFIIVLSAKRTVRIATSKQKQAPKTSTQKINIRSKVFCFREDRLHTIAWRIKHHRRRHESTSAPAILPCGTGCA